MEETPHNSAENIRHHEMTLEEAIAFGTRHHQGGRLLEAEHIYKKILEAYPNQPDAAHFLGVVSHQLGRTEEAITLLESLLEECPDHVDLHNNLGRIYKDAGQLEKARARFEFATAAAPTRPDLWNNLGTVLRSLRDLDRSADCYRKAIELDPTYADAYLNFGNLLRRVGRDSEAADIFRRAVDLKPDQSGTYQNLSQALYRSGRIEEAMDVVREWLAFQPDNVSARHLAGAFGVIVPPDRASDEFVSQHFDEHAANFDEHLRDLEYRAPEILGAAIDKRLPETTREIRVLDAGCGTGLCGSYLRERAAVLDGVDLSAGMIAQAEERGNYDRLVIAELTAFLEETESPYELVVCADTLCYFGALEAVFLATARGLFPGGWFFFTVEAVEREEQNRDADYGLRFHGRYWHSQNYVRECLVNAGFVDIQIETETLRMETGAPVGGWLVSCQRNSQRH